MKKNKSVLLIGQCGSGKTWVMTELLKLYNTKKAKIGLNSFQIDEEKKIVIIGVYDGSVFQGSDKLSMAVMSDSDKLKKMQDKHDFTIIAEGDRFTNSTFINKFKPYIIKIKDNGKQGRDKRNSNQSERHLKSIESRVNNIKENINVKNSAEALEAIKKIIKYEKS